jgi:hypothetical protein
VRIGKKAFYTQAAMPNLDSAYGFAQQVMVSFPLHKFFSLPLREIAVKRENRPLCPLTPDPHHPSTLTHGAFSCVRLSPKP